MIVSAQQAPGARPSVEGVIHSSPGLRPDGCRELSARKMQATCGAGDLEVCVVAATASYR